MTAAAWTSAQFRAAVASAVQAESRTDDLLELLREEHPAYHQCGTAELLRRRGWILVELGRSRLPPDALPVVLEELQTGQTPYLLAAAAHALRQSPMPSPVFAPPLLRAIQSLARRDDVIDLSVWGGLSEGDTAETALSEALIALRWLGQAAQGVRPELLAILEGHLPLAEQHAQDLHDVLIDLGDEDAQDACCPIPLPWRRRVPSDSKMLSTDVVCFEDQDGSELTWREAFVGTPSIVAFFYTRCDNEQKCSLTVTKLAGVQRLLSSSGLDRSVRLAAITYDPDYDHPQRLLRYAQGRSLATGDSCRLLRATCGREVLQQYFALGVNFVGSLVNRHRVEVFVLDSKGAIRATYQRLGWDPAELIADVRSLQPESEREAPATRPSSASVPKVAAEPPPNRTIAALKVSPAGWALALALLPKCPICGATYLSVSGLAALPYLPGWAKAWPAVAMLLLVNLAALVWIARARGHWAPVTWSLAGAVLLVWPGLAMGSDLAMLLGAVAAGIGAALAVRQTSRRRRDGGDGVDSRFRSAQTHAPR